MTARRVALVHPGLASYGERRRTETWLRLAGAAGCDVRQYPVLARPRQPTGRRLGRALDGRMVPEAAAWNGAALRAELLAEAPDVVILQTARTVRPEVVSGPWASVIDLVDLLSISYRQRASLSGGPRRWFLRGLARAHDRFEIHAAASLRPLVLAGRAEADRLGALWIPNLVDVVPEADPTIETPFDAVFFGSLGYRPNVEALEWLARADPAAAGLRILVAGRGPTAQVRSLCDEHGWSLVEDYPSNAWLADRAKVAIAPLQSTSGIQNKVLEAAAMGLAQVVTPAALAGLGSDLPCRQATEPEHLLRQVRDLVGDGVARLDLAERARAHVRARYSVEAWLPTFERLIDTSATGAVSPSVSAETGIDVG